MQEHLPQNQNEKLNHNLLRKTGVASLAGTLVLASAELPQPYGEEVRPMVDDEPVAHSVQDPPRPSRQTTTSSGENTNATSSSHRNFRYWYGTPEQLRVIKQQGNARNALIAYRMARKQPWYSWRQMRCINYLWFDESKFNELADNPDSPAHGVPQANPGEKMRKAGPDWYDNATTQIDWGYNDYIEPRYKTPCRARAHFRQKGWY